MSVVSILTGLFKKPIEHAAESAMEAKMNELAKANPEAFAALVHAWRAAKPELEKLAQGTATELDDLAIEVISVAVDASSTANGI